MILGFTGHRPDKLGGYDKETWSRLVEFATTIVEREAPKEAIIGMAIGWDMAVATACVVLKVPFIAAIPFQGQSSVWPSESKKLYNLLLSQASKQIVVCSGAYAPWKMLRRNEWMVDRSQEMVALWDGLEGGGTFKCCQYAEKKGVPFKNVWEEWRNFR